MIEFTWLPQSTGAWLIACSVFGALGYWMGVVREARKARIEVQAMGSDVNARVIPVDELAVHPDLLGRLHGCLLGPG